MAGRKRAVVIGGVNLDVRARCPEDSYASRSDASGHIEYAIGGCAYNVAWNLAFNKALNAESPLDVCLMSALSERSLDGHALLAKIRALGFDYKSLGRTTISGGYIVHQPSLNPGATTKAITDCPADDVVIDHKRLGEEIAAADLVYTDTNLKSENLVKILKLCAEHHKTVVIGVVSDDKARRIVEAFAEAGQSEDAPTVVCMNALEAKTIGLGPPANEIDAVGLRKHIGCQTLLITRGDKTTLLACADQPKIEIPVADQYAPHPNGAGDAFAATVVWFLAKGAANWPLSANTFSQHVQQALVPIFKCPTTTPDADDFGIPEGIPWQTKLPVPLYLAGALGALLSLGVGYTQQSWRDGGLLALFLTLSSIAAALTGFLRWHWQADQDGGDPNVSPRDVRRQSQAVVLSTTGGLIAAILMLGTQSVWFVGVGGEFATQLSALFKEPTAPLFISVGIGAITGWNYRRFFPFLDREAKKETQ